MNTNIHANYSEQRTLRLAETLSLADEKLLTEALDTDTCARLAAVKKPHLPMRRIQKIAVSAAVLLLTVALTATLLPQVWKRNGANAFLEFSQEEVLGGSFVLDSLDKLNYCVARIALSEQSDKTEARNAPNPLSSLDRYEETTAESELLDITHYSLDPDEIFRVTKTVYFEIDLKSEYGFLASMLGTGRTEVVITENSLETMITFRNGDRYFSCLLNGSAPNELQFTTHKYIEGYSIVKNFEQMNYAFTVTLNRSTVTDFTCRYSSSVSQNPMYAPDIASVIPDSTYTSKREVAFTLRSAQAFFEGATVPSDTTEKPSEGTSSQTLTAVYTSNTHEFDFCDGGTFFYRDAFVYDRVLRIGTYSVIQNETNHGIFLKFTTTDGSIYESVFVPFTDDTEAEFNYGGEIFYRARIDPAESEENQ